MQLWPVAGPAQADDSSAGPGTAVASADLLGVAPAVSGLSLTSVYGESKAAYEGTEAQASSATIDLGSLGLVLANMTFCGQTTLPASAQPKALSASSENGPVTATNGSGDLAGEQVTAEPSPLAASATTAPVDVSLPSVLSVRGYSQATVSYGTGGQQEADGAVTEDVSLLGGLVDLTGLTWQAVQHSGAAARAAATFSLGAVKVAGVPLTPPPASPAAAIAAVNTVLAPLGFSLSLPASTSDPTTGSVAIGPLVLQFRGSAVERTVLSPAVAAVTTLETDLARASQPGRDCAQLRQLTYNLGTGLNTLLNLALAIAQGAGSLDFDLGGASAGTQAPPDYANPFGASGSEPGGTGSSSAPGLDAPSGAGPVIPGSSAPDGAPLAGPGPGGGSAFLAPNSQASGAAPSLTDRAGPGTSSPAVLAALACHTTSPAAGPGCWRGLGTLAGAGAVAVGAALFCADYRQSHRRRLRPAERTQPDE